MLAIDQIEKYYTKDIHKFERGVLREYLQYMILSILFSHKIGRKLSFLGGTNLRIVHKMSRFSEDLDFDNKNLTYNEFKRLSQHLKRKLEKQGFDVEIRLVEKEAFYCYIKFPDILYKAGLSSHKQEKVMVRLDTFDQKVTYERTVFILDKFEFFDQILVTPKEVILSQKLWTITQRNQLKGRDFYDIMFLLQNTAPDKTFLKSKFGTDDLNKIRCIVLKHLKDVDFDELARDVAPFLLSPTEVDKVKNFKFFFEQQLIK